MNRPGGKRKRKLLKRKRVVNIVGPRTSHLRQPHALPPTINLNDGSAFELPPIINTAGKPHVDITAHEVEKLARLGCNDLDMAYWFECTPSVITAYRKRYGWWQDAEAAGLAQARMSLRQLQMRAALAGNTTMLVWLGKNMLHQSDRSQIGLMPIDEMEDSRPPVTAERVLEVVSILKEQNVLPAETGTK